MAKRKFNESGVAKAIADLLDALGEDKERDGLIETPARVARMWKEIYSQEKDSKWTAFEAVRQDQLVVVKDMRVWSFCEHHLLPFWCDVAIGYLANRRLLGLSKFGRITRACAGRLQMQERLVEDIAKVVTMTTCSKNVAVLAKGEHLCMTMRGVRMPSRMVSSVMHGAFREDAQLRNEFLALVK
jgi:GTP cyclohydrolase I